MRSQIAAETRELLHVNLDDSIHNECTPGRQERDNTDEKSLVLIMKRFEMFKPDAQPQMLQIIATKDLATSNIQDALLNAKTLGQEELNCFAKEKMINPDPTAAVPPLYSLIKKTKHLQ